MQKNVVVFKHKHYLKGCKSMLKTMAKTMEICVTSYYRGVRMSRRIKNIGRSC